MIYRVLTSQLVQDVSINGTFGKSSKVAFLAAKSSLKSFTWIFHNQNLHGFHHVIHEFQIDPIFHKEIEACM